MITRDLNPQCLMFTDLHLFLADAQHAYSFYRVLKNEAGSITFHTVPVVVGITPDFMPDGHKFK
ncbi:hypothetical protein D3C84_1127370 [compost metagenome]